MGQLSRGELAGGNYPGGRGNYPGGGGDYLEPGYRY